MRYQLENNMKFMQLKYDWIDIDIYKKMMYTVTISIFVFFGIISFLYWNSLSDALLTSFISAIFVIALFYYYPFTVKTSYIGKIEKDLPFFLMDLDIKLSIGMNFIASLESLTKEYDFIGDLFRQSLNQYEKGIPFHRSFLQLSEFYESQDFKRALNQIFAVYQSGYNTETQGPLFSLAEELLDKQKAEAKVYHSKLVMASLIFIGVTALLPSLFLVFVTIGGAIMDVGISAIELMLIFVVVFPVIDLLIIFVIYNIMPSYLK